MLNVIVHIPVDPACQRAHIYGSGIESMISYVFSESCMLGDPESDHEPVTIKTRKPDEHQRLNTANQNT